MSRKREPTFDATREMALGLAAYGVYLLVRRAVMNERGERQALENARRVAAVEQKLGIHVEARVQEPLLNYPAALHVLGLTYAVANVGLTVGWLIRLFRRRDPEYHRLRTATLLATLGAMPFFWKFPCAPPRRLEHIVDTISDVTGVDMDHGAISRFYDPIAAMPSIHVTYATITASGVIERSPSRSRRGLARLYTPLVTYTVLVTGNHFVLDAVIGWVLGKIAYGVSRLVYAQPRRVVRLARRPRRTPRGSP